MGCCTLFQNKINCTLNQDFPCYIKDITLFFGKKYTENLFALITKAPKMCS